MADEYMQTAIVKTNDGKAYFFNYNQASSSMPSALIMRGIDGSKDRVFVKDPSRTAEYVYTYLEVQHWAEGVFGDELGPAQLADAKRT